jgi:hypothetical protein
MNQFNSIEYDLWVELALDPAIQVHQSWGTTDSLRVCHLEKLMIDAQISIVSSGRGNESV